MEIGIGIAICLQVILVSLSMVEELAITKILPMLHVVRLTHGNSGTTGNTSLVWQKSTLRRILPDLSVACQYICIQHQSRNRQ